MTLPVFLSMKQPMYEDDKAEIRNEFIEDLLSWLKKQ
jgi:hypothetical protein